MNSSAAPNSGIKKSDQFQPLVTIITVVFNGEETIERTIQSITSQDYRNLEYIIVDGRSNDNTGKIIQQYSSGITRWISEPDQGLYDAMNKGIKMATGDYLWFINSGDEIATSDVLSTVFSQFPPSDIYYGETMIVDSTGCEIGLRRLRPPKKMTWKDFRKGMLVSHQSVIVSKKIAGFYQPDYHFSADFEWVLKAFKQAKSITNTNMVLSRFLDGGLTKKNILQGLKERFQIMTHYYGVLLTLLYHIPISFKFIYFIVNHRRF